MEISTFVCSKDSCVSFPSSFCFCLFVFETPESLCSSGFPGTHSVVDKANFEFRGPPASDSQVLEPRA